jgi:hypothetical protein
MELAIEVMRQTVSEPRKDGKASPLVGAVLYKPDGTIETACRGELRHRVHAVGEEELQQQTGYPSRQISRQLGGMPAMAIL